MLESMKEFEEAKRRSSVVVNDGSVSSVGEAINAFVSADPVD
jgi:hypothetical protein